jgi:hypothetical protein
VLLNTSVLLKKFVVPFVVCSTLLVGVVSVGGASAAVPSAVTATTKNGSASTNARTAKHWLTKHRSQLRRAVVSLSSKTIGVSRQVLVSDLRSGQSIAEVAAAHNVTMKTVDDALVKAADTELSKAVSSHKLTTADATKIKARVPGLVAKLVNHRFAHKVARAPTPATS